MVHPALLSRNFSSLLPHIRSRVSRAVHGPVQDLVNLCNDLDELPHNQLVLLLPVFFIHLDPSSTPTVDRLDATLGTETLRATVERGFESLSALATLADLDLIPLDVAPDLWPRVWPWMDFIQTYWNYLPGFRPSDQLPNCARMATLINTLQGHQETTVVIAKTRGVRTIFARVWARALHDDSFSPDALALHELHRILFFLYVDNDMRNPENLAEVVAGTGGIEGLVLALKRNMTHACAVPPCAQAIGSLGAAIDCVLLLHTHYKDLPSLLLSEEMIPTFITALGTLSTSLVTGAPLNAHVCVLLLEQGLRDTPQLVRAMEAGFLSLVIPLAIMSPRAVGATATMGDVLKTVLSEVLPLGLTSFRFVSQLRTMITNATVAASSAQFRRSPLFDDWTRFVNLAESRINVLDAWQSAGRPLLQACDNLKCGLIKPRGEFKACSACQSAVYCSPSCQSADWQDTHRDDCHTLLSARQHLPLLFRERAFLRALFHSDYKRMRLDIARRTVGFIRENPGIPFCTAYNYRTARLPTFEVGAQVSFDEVKAQLGPDWELRWQRMARAEGRMELHMLMLPQGFALFPTHSSTSKFRDGLMNIATALPGQAASDALDTQLRDLIRDVESDLDFVETH
ncbi:hypothetical protein DFH06DRAFT_1203447 [Mycena polygramma]|nr:hypothetical protein DFH06DRAFT_1203447 [Mycena polygramma]